MGLWGELGKWWARVHWGCVPLGSGSNVFRCLWIQVPMGLWADGVGTNGVRGRWAFNKNARADG